MRSIKIISTVISGGALAMGSSEIMAQKLGVEYTTEWQTDFKGEYDWLNLLNLTAEAPICSGLTFEASTISTAKTREEPLIADLLTYSNIEAGNIPLTFARMGMAVTAGDAEVFVGINNVNEDYFTSAVTSFFTNSSCGISPTISCNYDIANYPLAAWCLHYKQRIGTVSAQTSLYPGRGYSRLAGHDNLFELNIKRDGILSISSIDYQRNGLYTVLGVALYHGINMGDEEAEQGASPTHEPKKSFSAAPWLLSEISLTDGLEMHLHGSLSTVSHGCKWYGGVGMIYSGWRVQPGVALNVASFSSTSEGTAELTCRVPLLSGAACLQPALHLISTDRASLKCVAMLRLQISLN